MKNIMEQQLELHFGDEFVETREHAAAFITALIHRNWWMDNRDMLVDGEGGIPAMINTALCWIIQKGDRSEGLESYSRFLLAEYSPHLNRTGSRSGPNHTNWLPIEAVSEDSITAPDGDTTLESLLGDSSGVLSNPLHRVVSHSTDTLFRDSEEEALFETMASVGGNSAAIAGKLLGMDPYHTRLVYKRVRERAARRYRGLL